MSRLEEYKARAARGDKPTLVYAELGSCDGCSMIIVNLDTVLLDLVNVFDIKQMRIAMRGVYDGPIDVLMLEGAVTCEEEAEELLKLRERADYVVAVGACAALGGIPGMAPPFAVKNAQDGKFGKHVQGQGPMAPRPVHEIIRVDAVIPGCPPKTEDLVRAVRVILAGGRPDYSDRPVCMECALKDNGCLLLEGRACVGAVTKSGCDAYCPSNGGFCWACRGLLPDAPIDALFAIADIHGISIEEMKRKLRMANQRHFTLLEAKEEK
jgi:coenzyme F420-reducing hydrogenase gamma subunit